MMTEDLTAFFDADELATEVTLDGDAVVGILERGYTEVSGIGSTDPTFTLPLSSAPAVVEGSELVDGATTYVVRNVEPDGTGLVVLRLEVQS